MLINRENYGAFFLDYIEGNLTAGDKEQVMAFLEQNPDLKAEFEKFGSLNLVPDTVVFEKKQTLKKQPAFSGPMRDSDTDYYCIAKMEGDLSIAQEREFEKKLAQNPQLFITYKQYLKTLLEPDKSVVFPHKQQLRRRIVKPLRNHWLIAASVAASVALIVLSYQVYNSYRFEEKKIYTAIHEKLKIDSLLTTVVAGPVKPAPVIAQNNTVKHVAAPQYAVIADTIKIEPVKLRRKLPIEIVELSAPNEPVVNIQHSDLAVLRAKSNMQQLAPRNDFVEMKNYASNQLKKKLENTQEKFEESKKLWDLALNGFKQINKFTGYNLLIVSEKDTINNRNIFAFQSNILGIYSSTTKNRERQ